MEIKFSYEVDTLPGYEPTYWVVKLVDGKRTTLFEVVDEGDAEGAVKVLNKLLEAQK